MGPLRRSRGDPAAFARPSVPSGTARGAPSPSRALDRARGARDGFKELFSVDRLRCMATRGMTDDDMGGFVTRSANASTFAARTRASDGAFRRRARERGIERARVFVHGFTFTSKSRRRGWLSLPREQGGRGDYRLEGRFLGEGRPRVVRTKMETSRLTTTQRRHYTT